MPLRSLIGGTRVEFSGVRISSQSLALRKEAAGDAPPGAMTIEERFERGS